MKLPLLKQHEVNLLLNNTDCENFDEKSFNRIDPNSIKTITFRTRAERISYLEGLKTGLDSKKARLMTLNDVTLVCDMAELADLQDELAGIEGVA